MAYTRFILPKRCSNGHKIGYLQKDFEEYLEENYDKIRTERELTEEDKRIITNQGLVNFNWNKLCCRNSYINSRIAIISDSNKVVYTDTLGLSKPSKIMRSPEDIIYKSGNKYVPTKDVPLFPGENEMNDSDSEESIKEEPVKKVKRFAFKLVK